MSRKARALPSSTPDDTSVSRPRTATRTAPGAAARWRALFGSEPPHASGFIDQAIAWREQVDAAGDVAPAIARDLAIAARQVREGRGVTPASQVVSPPAPPSPVPGSILSTITPASPSRSAPPRTRPRPTPVLTPLPPASSQLVPGTRLVKAHGGRNHVVEVTETGLLYEGTAFTSLSAIAKHITGTHWNGLLFFGLRRRKTYPAKVAAVG